MMLPKGANLQKIRNGVKTYAVTPHLPGGFVKPEVLEKYAQVARKYHGTLKREEAEVDCLRFFPAEALPEPVFPVCRPGLAAYRAWREKNGKPVASNPTE